MGGEGSPALLVRDTVLGALLRGVLLWGCVREGGMEPMGDGRGACCVETSACCWAWTLMAEPRL